MLADYPWDGEASTLDWSETYSLHAAAEAGLVDEVRRLLDLAVDLTDAHEPHRGWTPLQYALAGSHEAVVSAQHIARDWGTTLPAASACIQQRQL
jgi:hypothetical protein